MRTDHKQEGTNGICSGVLFLVVDRVRWSTTLRAKRASSLHLKQYASLVRIRACIKAKNNIESLLSNVVDLKERGAERRAPDVLLRNIKVHSNAFGPWCRAIASLKDEMKQLL